MLLFQLGQPRRDPHPLTHCRQFDRLGQRQRVAGAQVAVDLGVGAHDLEQSETAPILGDGAGHVTLGLVTVGLNFHPLRRGKLEGSESVLVVDDNQQNLELLLAYLEDMEEVTAIEAHNGVEALEYLRQYADTGSEAAREVRDIIAERRKAPQDDLISAMIHAQEEEDALTDLELLATSNLLLLAGHETTTNLIGNGMLALMRERDEWARLCADPTLVDSAVEELLRFDPPVHLLMRSCDHAAEFGGRSMAEGDKVIFGQYSGNAVKVDGEELIIMNESEIYGVVE